MARHRRRAEEQENHERWLVSYADFITLLFAFFVVMYSISSLNQGKYKVLSTSLVAVFAGSPTTPSPIRTGQPDANMHRIIDLPPLPRPTSIAPVPGRARGDLAHVSPDQVRRQLDQATRTLQQHLAPQIKAGQVNVHVTPQGIVLDIHDNLLFASGQATLAPVAENLLRTVATVLAALPYDVQVNGYTDDRPISTPEFRSNWDLSASRAVSVVDTLVRDNVAPEQLVAAGYGQYHPVASNATAEGRAANRRVSIVIVAPPQSRGADGASSPQRP